MQKNQKTITQGKRTAKTKLRKKQQNEKQNYRYCSSQLPSIDESDSLIIDRMTELIRATPAHCRRLLRRYMVARPVFLRGAVTRLKMKIH